MSSIMFMFSQTKYVNKRSCLTYIQIHVFIRPSDNLISIDIIFVL